MACIYYVLLGLRSPGGALTVLCESFHQGVRVGDMIRVTTAMAANRMIAGSAVCQPVAINDGSSTSIAIEIALRMRPHPIVMALRAIVFDDIERAVLAEVLAGTLCQTSVDGVVCIALQQRSRRNRI